MLEEKKFTPIGSTLALDFHGRLIVATNKDLKAMVNEWISINESRPAERMKPETWEQKNMQTAQRKMPEIKYYNFPPEYTFITDTHRQMFPGVTPIIEHFQESRRYVHKK